MTIRSITFWFVAVMCFIAFIGVLPVFQNNYLAGMSFTTWIFIVGYWILPLIVLYYDKIAGVKEKEN